MKDILITEAMVEGWKKEQADLNRRLALLDHMLKIIPVLTEEASSLDTDADSEMSATAAVLAVLERGRGRRFVPAEIMARLREMQYVPAEKWGPQYKYLYTVLKRLLDQGRIEKIDSQYGCKIAHPPDLSQGESIIRKIAASVGESE